MKMNSAAKAVGIGMAIGGTAIAIGSAMKSKSSGKAAKKNTRYTYTIIPYKKGKVIRVSKNAAPWASGVTTRSKKKNAYNVTGGSATIRIEGEISLASIAAQTNAIAAQAAAKALGAVNGQRVSDVSPALVLPCFTCVRLVPFGPGAAGRYGMSNLATVRSLLGLLGKSGGDSGFSSLLKEFGSSEFRDLAEQWYSQHGHTDADGCRPPTSGGPERGGGTPYGI